MKKRILVALLLVLTGLGIAQSPSPARADTYSGKSGTWCDTAFHPLFTMALDGTVATVRVRQQRIAIPATTIVREYWLYTAPGGGVSSPGNMVVQGPGTFYDGQVIDGLNGDARYLSITMKQGSTGTLTLYANKPASYNGGCYTVDNVGVEVLHYVTGNDAPPTGGGGMSPNPSPTPAPTQPASPAPGWCVNPDYDPAVPGTGAYIPCETIPPPSPTPTPAPSCDIWTPIDLLDTDGVTIRHGYTLVGCALSWSQADAGYYEAWNLPALPVIDAGAGGGKRLTFRVGVTGRTTDGDSKGALCISTGAYPTGALPGGCVGWIESTATILTASYTTPVNGSDYRTFWDCGWGACGASHAGNGDPTAGGVRFWWYPAFTVLANPWDQANVTPTPTPAPSPTPTPAPTLPPSFAPSFPPNPYGGGNTAGIDCTDADLMNRAICEQSVTYSFAPATANPDAVSQLVTNLQGKAPFGYVSQAVDALGDGFAGAAAAGPSSWCWEMPAFLVPSAEACLPLEDWIAQLAWVRTAALAVVTLVFALGLIRVASSFAQGG